MVKKITDPYSTKTLKNLITEQNLRLKKSLGQNFLVSKNIADSIVKWANITKSDCVIEIGTGLLALTLPLARSSNFVISFELDKKITEIIDKYFELPSNVRIINQDFLQYNLLEISNKLQGSFKIIGNLPYVSSSQILIKLLQNNKIIEEATLAFQEELAKRIFSAPARKDYGTLSILSSLITDMELGLKIPPSFFFPKPSINSQIIKFRFRKPPSIDDCDLADFGTFLQSVFRYRRKTLLNTLKNAFFLNSKKELELFLKGTRIKPQIRLETLAPQQILELFKQLRENFTMPKESLKNCNASERRYKS